MKRKDLEKELKRYGWWLKRHGSNHDIWTNGELYESIPRHTAIKRLLAKKILKKAQDAFKEGDSQ